MFKRIWFIAAFLIISFVLAVNWYRLPNLSSQEQTTVRESSAVIGYSNSFGWWPWAIAESEDLFVKHGLKNVELRWYDSYSQSIEDMASGFLDGNCQSLNDTIFYAPQAIDGEVIVLINSNSVGNDKIIVSGDITSIEDLKNKQVGIEEGLVEDYLLTLALLQKGMNRKDVDIIDVETGAATEAFKAGMLDGVGTFAPYWKQALHRDNAREIISSKDFPNTFLNLLVVSQKLIEQQPDLVQGLVDTWFDVLAFIEENPQQAKRIIAERAGIDIKDIQLFNKGTRMLSIEDNVVAFKDQEGVNSLSVAANKAIDFYIEQFQSIEKKPNLDQLIDSQFVLNKE